MNKEEVSSVKPIVFSSNPSIGNPNPNKRKRNLPGTPDPDAEVIAMSPKSLMATNRFVCEICSKGFQRDQNLQLHRRGHNLPWKLKQRNKEEVVRKKVYICPEKSCAHHHPSRALGDLTGIKKHYSRKHGEKKWKCDKCSKKYAVMSDWKAHNKICGTREYKCDCGTLFSRQSYLLHLPHLFFSSHHSLIHFQYCTCRKDSFITHRAFCDALVEETNAIPIPNNVGFPSSDFSGNQLNRFPLWLDTAANNYPNQSSDNTNFLMSPPIIPQQQQWLRRGQEESFVEEDEENNKTTPSLNYYTTQPPPMSATALLQKAAQMGSTRSGAGFGLGLMSPSSFSTDDHTRINEGESSFTRDFLGVGGKDLKSNFFASATAMEMEMPHFNRTSK